MRRTLTAIVAVFITSCTTTTTPTTTTTVGLEQPAVWPAAEVVFDTPEAAAADFVRQVLGVPPRLGEFMAGDLRSGEIEVFVELESGEPIAAPARGLLLVRQLGPGSGWFVIGGASSHVTITAPDAGQLVPAGPLTVEGIGRGFEATLVVSAFVAGSASPVDQVVTFGGGLDLALPYRVELDLTSVTPGATVGLLVRGGAGLETDPGEFAVIPVRIGSLSDSARGVRTRESASTSHRRSQPRRSGDGSPATARR